MKSIHIRAQRYHHKIVNRSPRTPGFCKYAKSTTGQTIEIMCGRLFIPLVCAHGILTPQTPLPAPTPSHSPYSGLAR